jgi:hypothetical protein
MIAGDAVSAQVKGSAREMLAHSASKAKGKRKAKGESESGQSGRGTQKRR